MIRKATQNDFEFICELYMHPQVNRFLLYETMGSAEFTPIFDKLLADDVLYMYEASGEPAGMFKLVRLEHRTSHIGYLGGLAIHPAFSGKGHGKALMQEILSLGKELGFVRIELGVSTINARAIRLYENAGFESEGIRKKAIYLRSERLFLDDISMAYLYE